MTIFRLFKALTLTTAGSVLIATSAIALNDIRSETTATQCNIAASKISVQTLP